MSLSPEMIADGWLVVADGDVMWAHPVTREVVRVSVARFCDTINVQALIGYGYPFKEETDGFVVSHLLADEDGVPVKSLSCVWVRTNELALALAKEARIIILEAHNTGVDPEARAA